MSFKLIRANFVRMRFMSGNSYKYEIKAVKVSTV